MDKGERIKELESYIIERMIPDWEEAAHRTLEGEELEEYLKLIGKEDDLCNDCYHGVTEYPTYEEDGKTYC